MSSKKIALTTRYYPNACSTSPYLSGFVDNLQLVGYSITSISFYQRGVLHLGRWADKAGISVKDFNEEVLSRFRGHLKICKCGPNNCGQLKPTRLAASLFLAHLRRMNVALPAPALQEKRSVMMKDFREWMSFHRGASTTTIDNYEKVLVCFFSTLGENPDLWSVLKIRSFVLKRFKHRSCWEVKRLTNALRALLRFLATQGRCKFGWEKIIPTIPQWKLSSLPQYLEPNVVKKVIAACKTSTPNDLRDRAILILLARLGLRGGDIIKMKLDDIDWIQARLRVCGKQRRETYLSLPQDVGNAILAYLKRGRPPVAIESVFLCIQAPYRPFNDSGSVSSIVKKALLRAGVKDSPGQGAHLLRHSAATGMIRQGCTLETVATLLRHKSIDTTAHYAKVDIKMLNTVTQPWPKEVLC